MLKPWDEIEREELARTPVMSLYRARRVSPRTGRAHDFSILDLCDFVNVVAITPHRELVMIRQYRHGVSELTLEIPGGLIDPGDADPEAAGRRELREETGFAASSWRSLGSVQPNPAIQNNRCYTLWAEGARRAGDPDPDAGEEIEVVLVPLDDIPARVAAGEIAHALVLVALGLAWGFGGPRGA